MFRRTSNLDRLKVIQPCDESWDQMSGDDRARFCAHCQKTVFNLAEMTRSQAERLIQSQEGSLCARVTRMSDGRVKTASDPRSIRFRLNRWMAGLALTAATAWAENQRGIRVTVADPTDARIPNARVLVFSPSTKITRFTTTNDEGEAWFPEVPAGNYTIVVDVPGFAVDRSGPLAVSESSVLSHSAAMKPVEVTMGAIVVTDYRRPLLKRLFPFAFRGR